MNGHNIFQHFMRNIFFKHTFKVASKNVVDKRKKGVGGIMLLSSPILFEVNNKEEENPPKSEYIFLAGKSIDFLTQKIFENEFGTSILYVAFFVAYLSLLVHDNKINLMVQKLKYKYANNMFTVGHPNYKKYLPKNPLIKNKQINK
ncbi:conserved Plasmodium protein, unknown function [Plasmodium sp. gorilla clade G2]|uniref:conserved Plasmodium protein, unknown function n=1 Tax=Plasmodium sp. gorilla clade G2 TaxID=880535 RepID=UPI000D227911|nr:conserved Plasmodium protein, unknown function [Plasmodium sp. gorilla clade G2]SOV14516.1 conserved Plasmodium protein, unknown function [Plasmodium sp. gorilla clade G2]